MPPSLSSSTVHNIHGMFDNRISRRVIHSTVNAREYFLVQDASPANKGEADQVVMRAATPSH